MNLYDQPAIGAGQIIDIIVALLLIAAILAFLHSISLWTKYRIKKSHGVYFIQQQCIIGWRNVEDSLDWPVIFNTEQEARDWLEKYSLPDEIINV